MNWNKKIVGAATVKEALELADSFSADCRQSKAIPGWALALRALAGAYRRERDYHNGFKPGSFGFHELVDRASLMAEFFCREVREHPAVEQSPKLKKRVKKLEADLYQLYNDTADIHMNDLVDEHLRRSQ